jgi:hypothetical protein
MEMILGMPLPTDVVKEEFASLVTGELVGGDSLTRLAPVTIGAAPEIKADIIVEKGPVLVEDEGIAFGTEIGIETGQRLQRSRL